MVNGELATAEVELVLWMIEMWCNQLGLGLLIPCFKFCFSIILS